MALDRLTKIDGGGISTTSDYRVGIITARKFIGPFDGAGGNFTGVITATDGNFSGNVTIGGTLTYEDVTNIDSVGIITARDGIHVGAGVSAVGVITASSFHGDGSNLTGIDATALKDPAGNVKIQAQASGAVHIGIATFQDLDVDGHTNLDNVSIAGVTTFSGDLNIAENIIHTGDTNTKISFPSNDTIQLKAASNTITAENLKSTFTRPIHVGDYIAHQTVDSIGVKFFNQGTGNNNTYIGLGAEDHGTSGGTTHKTFRVYRQGGSFNRVNIDNFGNLNALQGFTVAGISTFSSNIDANGDLDVDGHTNLDNVSIAGVSTFSDDVTLQTANSNNILLDKSDNSLKFGNSTYAKFGGAGELMIYHDGTYSVIKDNNSSPFNFEATGTITFAKAGLSETYAKMIPDGAVELYHGMGGSTGSSKKFETTSSGVDISGDLVLPNSGSELKIWTGGTQGIVMGHGGSFGQLDNLTGNLTIKSGSINLANRYGNHNFIYCNASNSVDLYYDAANHSTPKLKTSATGITVDGEVAASQDYPNFRPTLDLNFAAEKKLDPRITYSRTGAASFVNEFGKIVLVGDNVPRFDHDIVTRESKGLLIEEARTNLALYSDMDMDSIGSAYYGNVNLARAEGPDGVADSALQVTFTAAGSSFVRSGIIPCSAGVEYTFSVWIKKVSGSFNNSFFSYPQNASAGLFNNSGFVNTEGQQLSAMPTGVWKRFTQTRTTASGTTGIDFVMPGYDSNGAVIQYYGLQLEAGAFATSYIPSIDGSSTSRGADQTYIDGDDFLDFYNQLEGTVISSHSILPNIPSNHNLYTYQISPTGATAYAPLRILDKNSSIANSIAVASVYNNGYTFLTTDTGNPVTVAGRKYVIAASIKKDDYDAVFDGGDLLSDSSGDLYTADHISFGYYKPSPQAYLNGHIQRLIYYPTKLTNNQLKTITS